MKDVVLPQLGESVTEGTLNKWLKQVGEEVHKYDPLVEVITDKVTAEVPSDFDGTLAEIVVSEGETVSVGTVICRISAADEEPSNEGASQPQAGTSTPEPSTSATASRLEAETRQTAPLTVHEVVAPVPTSQENEQAGAKKRFSPAVLKLAEEHQVDLTQVLGSGEGGRITRKDILQFINRGAQTAPPSMASPEQVQAHTPSFQDASGLPKSPAQAPSSTFYGSETVKDAIIEPDTIRKTIARRMLESKQTAPHAWTMVEADVTKLVDLRQRIKAEFKRNEGIDLTYLPFFIKAVAEALKQYPLLNASWIDNKIHMHQDVNISIAVATDNSLSVPVIHHADRLSIAGLAHAVNDVAARARSGRLQMSDVEGGTFTVNNTGAFGSILSQPIINTPQSAILSVESIVKRPVVVNDAIAVRSMVNLCLSLDHRLLDGWISGNFLKMVKQRMENYDDHTPLY